MSLIAEFRLASPKLALHETRQAVPDFRLEVEQEVGTDPERPLFFFWAERAADGAEADDADRFDAFEEALREDPTAADEVVLDRFADRRFYRVQLTDDVGVLMYPKFVGLGAELLHAVGDADGWYTRMRFTDRETLAEFREYCVGNDVTFDLERVYDESDDTTDRLGLTKCQREAVEAALRAGYFEVPRDASLGDVAEELDISTQSASERLRRGVRTLALEALDDGRN